MYAFLLFIVTFLFFEWLLKIPLPQGISEPLFYPVYDVMYGSSSIFMIWLYIIIAVLSPSVLAFLASRFIK